MGRKSRAEGIEERVRAREETGGRRGGLGRGPGGPARFMTHTRSLVHSVPRSPCRGDRHPGLGSPISGLKTSMCLLIRAQLGVL